MIINKFYKCFLENCFIVFILVISAVRVYFKESDKGKILSSQILAFKPLKAK